MNDDFNLEFKDKEIDKLTSDINRENRRQFGRTFKSAAEAAEQTRGPQSSAADFSSDMNGNMNDGATPSGTMPAGALETVMPTSAEEVREDDLSAVNTTSDPSATQTPPTLDTSVNDQIVSVVSASEQSDSEDHSAHIAPIFSPSSNANDEQKELYAIAKPLRTYERDIAEAIREKNASVTSINLAAQKKREETGEKKVTASDAEQASRKGLIILVSILLILASVSFGAIAYYFFTINQPAEIIPGMSTIIAADASVTVNITDMSNNAATTAITDVLSNKGNPNTLIHVAVVENVERTEQGKVQVVPVSISVAKFFELFARSAPPALIRALGPEWMFGFQTLAATGAASISTNEPFIFTRVSSFDNAWNGMLEWESNMLRDLSPLLPNPEVVSANADRDFQDMIIRNKDVRVLRDSFGNTLLMYSFLDSRNLLITTSEQTFREILGRFFSSQIVR